MKDKPEIYIDFSSAENNHRRLYGGGNGQPIAKAVGIKTYGLPLHVIDATAGLGQDAFVLACLGCRVTMIERSTVIADLLEGALERGAQDEKIKNIITNMKLIKGNAVEVLKNLRPDQYPDVIYLDPMFPERKKSALVKQEMRLLKDIVGDDEDADQLLDIARTVAKKRVTVKRPKIANFLANLAPHSSQAGKANRFDIYMPKQ